MTSFFLRGIDYMLEAKLASNRANEAEQKNQRENLASGGVCNSSVIVVVLQVELLQSQSEVKRLLDQMTETNRHRSEMVSSKVHGQLMAIADEKARESERKVVELLKEVDQQNIIELNKLINFRSSFSNMKSR